MTEKLLKIASVSCAHGIGGEVRLKIFLEDKESFERLGPYLNASGQDIGTVDVRGQSKGQFIVRIAGTNTRDGAEALKGLNLFIPRSRLPELILEDEFYYADLIGLLVRENGTEVGHIQSVRDNGAGDLVEIRFSDGNSEYFTFSRENFPHVHVDGGYVELVQPEEVISQDESGRVH